ncbi:MAG: molecular chaperone DnaJ [Patescibacteria group bacterium]|nr:molecular chaperone DnaJ [Patescibacteria group bacterium]
MAKDFYETLGVGRSATPEEIKVAFRKLAHQYHPDKAGGNAEKFKEINAAYQVLSDPDKRKQYDQYGATFEQARARGGFQGFDNFRDFADYAQAFRNGDQGNRVEFDFGNLGDLFGGLGDVFGFSSGGGRRAAQRGGADMQVEIAVPFRDAVFGTARELILERHRACAECGGSGAQPGTKSSRCRTCGGRGQVVRSIGLGFGMQAVCPDCGGAGSVAEHPCKACRGKGTQRTREKLNVKIPAGIDDGQAIRLTGQGESAGRGGSAGDLYVRVRVVPDERISREGQDLKMENPISFATAALGGTIDLETLDGTVTLKIPEGTQSGKVFRIRGKGVPDLGGHGRGDLLVRVEVQTPTRLNRKQRDILEQFRDAE